MEETIDVLPHRLGEPLPTGSPKRPRPRSSRRGTYRILYRVVDEPREVVVLRIEHRRDVYRGR